MALNNAIRGQEATIRIALDGQGQSGTWLKVKDFTVTERTEFIETDYLGEYQTDLDKQHSGFDFSFSVDMQDDSVMTFISNEISREENQDNPTIVTMMVIYALRNGQAVGETYFDCVMKVNDQSFGSRTEYVSYSLEGKAKRRAVLGLNG